MTDLREAFRSRLSSPEMVRLLTELESADAVEADAGAIVDAAVGGVTGIVEAIVPDSLRPAVLRRLTERVDLLPIRFDVDGYSGFVEGVTTDPRDGMRADPRMHDALSEPSPADPAAILIPPSKTAAVDAIVDAARRKRPTLDVSTTRLVAWFFVDETEPERLAHTAAEAILSEAKEKRDDLATLPAALRELSRRVEDTLPVAPAPDLVAAADVVEGVHPLDEALAALVASFGQNGRSLAAEIRASTKTPEERAARWRPLADPLRVPRILARALWHDVVNPQLARVASRIDAPGLSLPVLTNLVRVSRNGAQPTMFDDGRADILDHKGRRVGSLQLTPTIGSDHINLANLGKLSTTRLVRHLLHRTWEQKWIHGLPEAHRIDVDGGFPGLAKVLGMKTHKAPEELREAVATLAALRIDSPTGEGQVFAYWHDKATGQRPARLEMHVMGPFAPDYIARSLAGHRRSAQDKYLVPVPLPQRLPPLVGRERGHAAQAFLQVLVLRELRVRAEELREVGSVEIGERQWETLRDEAGVPKATMRDVLAAYPIGNADGPAFLLSPTQGRYALADAYDQERRSILEAAEAMANGRAGGKAAAASRRRGGRKARAPK